MSKGDDARKVKSQAIEEICALIKSHSVILIATLDNVRSKHLQDLRLRLRGLAIMRVGKNTTIRYALRSMVADYPQVEPLISLMCGNVALVFTNSDPKVVRDMLIAERVTAPARTGSIAPCDVIIPAGNSGVKSNKTNFFQAIGIPTKIVKGNVEITSNYHLLKPGQRVGASDAALLNMLGISPFTYGVDVTDVYNEGSTFSPDMLDIDDEALAAKIQEGIRNVAAFSLTVGVATAASVPHSLINGYNNVLAVAITTGVTFPLAETVLDRINNPDAYASAAPASTGAKDATAAAAAPAAPAAVESESEEEGGFDLFD